MKTQQLALVGIAGVAVLGLFLLTMQTDGSGNSPKLPRRMQKPGPHLKHFNKGKHNEHFDHQGFDPKVAAATHENDKYYDADDHAYQGDDQWWDNNYGDDAFNISARLEELFPVIDENKDGFVTNVEMEKWHLQVGLNSSINRGRQEFETTDHDENGKVSLQEYLGDDFRLVEKAKQDTKKGPDDTDDEDVYNVGWVRTTMKTFAVADADQDGELNPEEFQNFLHPEDSADPKLLNHLLTEAVVERDDSKNGKLNFTEFEDNLWHDIKSWDASYHNNDDDHYRNDYGRWGEDDPEEAERRKKADEDDKANAAKRFKDLDVNNDGELDAEELRPELSTLHPGEADFAKRQGEHLVEQADDDKDQKLTLAEMQANSYVFYSAAMGDHDHPYSHDEFK